MSHYSCLSFDGPFQDICQALGEKVDALSAEKKGLTAQVQNLSDALRENDIEIKDWMISTGVSGKIKFFEAKARGEIGLIVLISLIFHATRLHNL